VEGSNIEILGRLWIKSINVDGPPVIGEGGRGVGLYYRHLGRMWGRVWAMFIYVRDPSYILEVENKLGLTLRRNSWTTVRLEKPRLREAGGLSG
jgi:hypothetical protein